MAILNITTNQTVAASGAIDNDSFTIASGAVLTADATTPRLLSVTATSLGDFFITNPSTTTPIFIRFGVASGGSFRFEAAGKLISRGARINIGTSNGTASQTFSLPTDAGGLFYQDIAQLQGFISGMTKPMLFTNTDDLSDLMGDEVFGRFFTHDTLANTVTFGDGTNGYIPPTGMVISVANIQFQNTASPATAYTFDFNASGTCDLEHTLWGGNWTATFTAASTLLLKDVGFIDSTSTAISSINGATLLRNTTIQGILRGGAITVSGLGTAPIFDNVDLCTFFNTNSTFLTITSFDGGTYNDVTVIKARTPVISSTRYLINSIATNQVFNNLNMAASSGGLFYATAGSSTNKINGVKFNAKGNRTDANFAATIFGFVNSTENVVKDFEHWPKDVSEGLQAPATNFLVNGIGGSLNLVYNGEFFAGDNITDNYINDSGTGNILANVDVYGQIFGKGITTTATSVNLKVQNVFCVTTKTLVNNNDMGWANGTRVEYGFTPDDFTITAFGEGANIGSMLVYRGYNDRTTTTIYRPMGEDIDIGLYTPVLVTGFAIFNNAGWFYLQNSGDIVEFETFVHRGITGFTGANAVLGTAGTYTVEVAMRLPSGIYTSFLPFDVTNLNTQFASLVGYDFNEGLQIKFRATKVNTNAVDHIRYFKVDCTSDAGYRELFEVGLTGTVTGLVAGSGVQIYNETTSTEIFNGDVAGTSLNLTYADGSDFSSGDVVRIRVTNNNGLVDYKRFETRAIATSGGWAALVDQEIDDVYTTYNLDGSTITKFSADYINTEVDLIIGSNWAGTELYAWWKYNLNTVLGRRLFFGGITAIDAGNLLIENDIVDLMFDNLTSQNVYQTDNIRIFRKAGDYPVYDPTTGGGGIDVNWKSQVFVVSTGGSALTPTESALLLDIGSRTARVDGLIEDVAGDRFTAKALEEGPAGGGGGGSYDDTVLIGKIDVIDANVDAIKAKTDTLVNTDLTGIATSANVTAAQSAIITEVNANETKIDAIKLRTDLIPADPATNTQVNTRLAAASYVAPLNAEITAIKAKTDLITFTGANVNAIANVVSDKTGYALTSAERTDIAVAVEQAILNDGDGQAILNAIVGAIGNQNIDEIALVAAIRADLERAGGDIKLIKAKTDTLVNADLSPVLSAIAALNNLSAAQVLTQVTNALNTYDGPTNAEINANQTALLTAIGSGGVTAAEIYSYFTALTRADAFKADLSAVLTAIAATATSAELAAQTVTLLAAIGTGGITAAQVYDYFVALGRANAFKADLSPVENQLDVIEQKIDDGFVDLTDTVENKVISRNDEITGQVQQTGSLVGTIEQNEIIGGL